MQVTADAALTGDTKRQMGDQGRRLDGPRLQLRVGGRLNGPELAPLRSSARGRGMHTAESSRARLRGNRATAHVLFEAVFRRWMDAWPAGARAR
jgi:hypothetical protein